MVKEKQIFKDETEIVIISVESIYEANKRISVAMDKVVSEYYKKARESVIETSKVVLNG